jgi:glycosyltransferase involved in cell wall biosynthesis
LRIAVVTSQFPIAGDESRGRPIVQTLAALARLADVKAFVPNACYPGWRKPRSYRYAAPPHGDAQVDGVAVHYVTYATLPLIGRVLNGYSAARALEAPIAAFAPDLVLAYWLYPDAFGAAIVAQRLGVPLVAGARGSDVRARDRVTLALTRRALARADRVLTVSDDLKRLTIERFGVPADRVTTAPNGCDTSLFKVGSRGAARNAVGLPLEGRCVLFVGRMVEAKGVRELCAAWLPLARRDPTLRLALVGDGPLREEARRGAVAAGVDARVHLPGVQDAAAVSSWMRASDVVCLPSHTEGYPNVLVEALACGRPIVATPVGGILEIVTRENGILAPVGDVEALGKALDEALATRWDEAALCRNSARSWHDVARETLAVCDEALRVSDRAATEDRCSIRTTS